MPTLLQITILLGTALILVPLLQKLKISTVLGYLLAGILLGPYVLNIDIQPQQRQEMTQLGMILLMFLIGLELRPQRLWAMRRTIWSMGSMQVAATAMIISLILYFIHHRLAVSLLIGTALALSSTSVVLQLLTEKQKLYSSFGQPSFAILLFQSMAAIPLIAILPLWSGHSTTPHGIAYFAAIITTFTGLFLVNRYMIRPFFTFIAQSGTYELIGVAALLMVVTVMGLMEMLGISHTLSAFLIGILLADSAFRYELETSIAPFKGLLLGLFFMMIGMNSNLSLLIDLPGFIIAATLLLLAIKVAVLIAVARYYQYSWQNSLLLATCLAQGGEFALILLTMITDENLLGQQLREALILIILLSICLTPLLSYFTGQLIKTVRRRKQRAEPDQHPVEIPQHPLIIAGFGRFGQIIARIASLQQLPFIAIDNHIEQITFVQKYTGIFQHGDVTRPDILAAAGVAQAKLFILAIDDIEDTMNVARYLRLNYPNLKLLVRARDRHHVHLLRDIGVTDIWRESYLSALDMAYQALCQLGITNQDANRSIQLFRDHDEQLLMAQQQPHYPAQGGYKTYHPSLTELEYLFESDAQNQQHSMKTKHTHDLNIDHCDVSQDQIN